MSIALSVSFVIRIMFIDCAPKLGPILFDPLLYEANFSFKPTQASISKKEISDEESDWLGANLRVPQKEITQISCTGYDFNENICKTIDDRVVCGYNKNLGPIGQTIIDLGNGCRIRNNRLECGYLTGPFDNLRRPPAMDDISENSPPEAPRTETHILETTTIGSSSQAKTLKVKKSENTTTEKVLGLSSSILTSTLLRTSPKPKKHCVEKNDHIFCYLINQA